MFGSFNRHKRPSPTEIRYFCNAATRGDGGSDLRSFLEKYGKGAVDSICPETGYTALMRAAQTGQDKNCEVLLAEGANINAQDKHGWTALMTAVNQNRQDVVATLLKHKADIDLANENKVTPLMTAAREGNETLVALLLEKGANPLLRNLAKQDAATFTRNCWTGGDAGARARIIAALDAASTAAQKAQADAEIAASMMMAGQVAESLRGGTDKPVRISRPLSFRN